MRIPARYRSAVTWAAAIALFAVLFMPMIMSRLEANDVRVRSRPVGQSSTMVPDVIVPRPGDVDITGAIILRPELSPEKKAPPARSPAQAANESSGD